MLPPDLTTLVIILSTLSPGSAVFIVSLPWSSASRSSGSLSELSPTSALELGISVPAPSYPVASAIFSKLVPWIIEFNTRFL